MLAPKVEPSRASFEPAGAGALLLGATGASVGVGALVGWAAGSVGIGILVGAVIGLPLGIFVVYRKYRNAF
jgi:F0F1-type ATP synthase assembly protein I